MESRRTSAAVSVAVATLAFAVSTPVLGVPRDFGVFVARSVGIILLSFAVAWVVTSRYVRARE